VRSDPWKPTETAADGYPPFRGRAASSSRTSLSRQTLARRTMGTAAVWVLAVSASSLAVLAGDIPQMYAVPVLSANRCHSRLWTSSSASSRSATWP
jgi:hypothetical protein